MAVALTGLADGGYGPRFSAAGGFLSWWVVALILCTSRPPAARLPRAAGGCAVLITAYAGWALASALWAPDAGRAVTEASRLLAYAGAFCAIVLLSRRGSIRAWLWGLLGGLAVVAIVAAASRFFPALAADRDALAASLPSAVGRLGYPVGYWNALGACMAMALVLLAAHGAYARSRPLRCACTAFTPIPVLVIYLASSRASAAAAALGILTLVLGARRRVEVLASLAVAAPACLLVTAFAADRGALLRGLGTAAAREEGLALFAVTLTAVAVTFAARYLLAESIASLSLPRPRRRTVIACAAGALLLAVVLADPRQRWEEFREPPDFGGPAASFTARHLQSAGGNGRYQFWDAAAEAFADEPVAGQGTGGYEPWWNRNGDLDYRLRDAHSVVFETGAELGLVGLATLVGFFALAAGAGVRRMLAKRRSGGDPVEAVPLAVLAAGFAAVLVDWSWEVPATALPILIAAALLTGAATASSRGFSGRRGALRRLTRPALVFGCLGAMLVLGHTLVVQDQLEKSRSLAKTGDLEAAGDAAARAEAIAPWAAEPHVQQALIAERLGDLPAAKREIAEAIDRAEEDWRLRVVATRIALESGDADAAVASLREARRLNPRAAVLAPRPPPPWLIRAAGSGHGP